MTWISNEHTVPKVCSPLNKAVCSRFRENEPPSVELTDLLQRSGERQGNREEGEHTHARPHECAAPPDWSQVQTEVSCNTFVCYLHLQKAAEQFRRLLQSPEVVQELDRTSGSKTRGPKELTWDAVFRWSAAFPPKSPYLVFERAIYLRATPTGPPER